MEMNIHILERAKGIEDFIRQEGKKSYMTNLDC